MLANFGMFNVLRKETGTVLRSGHGPAWGLMNTMTFWDPLNSVELFYQ
jgi:hypothetical protein